MLQERDAKLCELNSSRISSHYFNSFFINKLLDSENGTYNYGNVKRYDRRQNCFICTFVIINTHLLTNSHSHLNSFVHALTGISHTFMSCDAMHRWSKKFNIFQKEKIFCPVNISNTHWTMLVMFIREKKIQYYDSMGNTGKRYLHGALQYLGDEARKLDHQAFDASEWQLGNQSDTPQQENGFDCGVFSIMFADFISDNLPLNFAQNLMPLFRRKICANILRGSLKYPLLVQTDM